MDRHAFAGHSSAPQPPQPPQAVFRKSLPFCVDFRKTLAVDMSLHGERETGAAKRRRERQLRSWLKHERQTVRMVLAETFHHSSAPFPPKFKEEWVGRREHHAALRGQKTARTTGATHFPSSASVARGAELFSLEEEPGGGRPAPLPEVAGQQVSLERHVMEDLGTVCPFVQILDLLVPQTVDALRILDRPMASRLSKCRRSLALHVLLVFVFLSRSQRNSWWKRRPSCLLCASRSRSSAFHFLGVVFKRRVQGFLPVQSSTAAPSSGKRISEWIVEQIVDISPGGGLGQGSSSSAGLADEEVFSHFSP